MLLARSHARGAASAVCGASARPGSAAAATARAALRHSPCARRHAPLRRAYPEQPSPSGPQDTSEDPAAALSKCIAHIEAGDLDGLLEFVPDEVIDKVIEARRCNIGGGEPSWLRFTDVLQADASSHLYLDSFAIRHLALGVPRALRPLSTFRVSHDRYMQRCAVVAAGGEEAVLSFEMLQQECLENQYRGPPLMRKRWMLRSVRGEPAAAASPRPSPAHSPEAVLEAQLSALADQRYTDVFAHASPANRRATGPVQKFARMLNAPAFAGLLGHEAAETLQRLQPSPTVFMALVRVYPGGAARARLEAAAPRPPRRGGGAARPSLTYLWVLNRQVEASEFANCWMVDSCQPVEDVPQPGGGGGGGAAPPPPRPPTTAG
ncbi:hypothetical protein Rsub_01517 [Raphidocelis subcapitata]|uniref:Uncharacterized protein n=1 Tax=Raphidocelis subcapitata TaxID=307507 RepID=A0A2V0NN84_9CHLO|nr:hypothetical protein Rsub_01517 [Raphidocelis subcapitata]|eukprot:GBF89018.1 hypothetical protein Rsub_01517 [Raphidocelis subcapitata]